MSIKQDIFENGKCHHEKIRETTGVTENGQADWNAWSPLGLSGPAGHVCHRLESRLRIHSCSLLVLCCQAKNPTPSPKMRNAQNRGGGGRNSAWGSHAGNLGGLAPADVQKSSRVNLFPEIKQGLEPDQTCRVYVDVIPGGSVTLDGFSV